MKFTFYAPVHFEKWDWRSPDDPGIGGSETAVCEMARRLAVRGHDVAVYAPIRDDCPAADPGGARWMPLEAADFGRDGVWVLSRCPADVDRLQGQRAWVVCQDVEYASSDGFSPERAEKIEKVLTLCPTHRAYYARRYPHLGDRLTLSANGIKLDRMRAMPPVDRDPFKLVYYSSPDRGLISLLHVFRRAREFEPRLSLSVAYGLDNIKKCEGPAWRKIERDCERLLDQPGVTWLGRIPQPRLWEEIASAGLWVYPTNFQETSCISCLEAQALGAIPIVSAPWALGDNVGHGVVIGGDAGDPLTRARFVRAVLDLAWNPGLQEQIRAEMVPWARERFNWERVADDYEGWAAGYTDCASWYAQYAFQLRHARGRVLNLGCNADLPGFGRRGAINVDLHAVDPFTNAPNAAHVLADARRPLPVVGEYDTVILGDVLEHMGDDDAVSCLRVARDRMAPDGKVLLTVPEDHRGEECPAEYAPDIPGGHPRPITDDVLARWLGRAGLRAEVTQPIDYGQFTGRGVVACV